jgi:hypothetical protein
MDRKRLTLIMAVCGGLAALGSLLPWATVKSFGGSISASGVESTYGVFVLILGLAAGAAALLVYLGKVGQLIKLDERQHLFIALGCFALALLFTLIQFFSSGYQSVSVMGTEVGASRGFGLWLALLATIGGAGAAFMTVRNPTTTAPPAEPPKM